MRDELTELLKVFRKETSKVQTAVCQQIWNNTMGHRLKNGVYSHTVKILHSFLTQTKACLRSYKEE